jgi:hypothetical protein
MLFIVFNSPFLQAKLVQLATKIAHEKYGVHITVGKAHVIFPDVVVLKSLAVYDQAGDTLLAADGFRIDVGTLNFNKTNFKVNRLRLDKPFVNLHQYPDSTWNFDFLINYQDTVDEDTLKPDIDLLLKNLQLFNGKLLVNRTVVPTDSSGSIDFNHLDVESLFIEGKNLLWREDSLSGELSRLSLKEVSGFRLLNLSADLGLNKNSITLNKLNLIANQSNVAGSVTMNFNSFVDFKNFNELVEMQASLERSEIHFKDIGYFAYPLLKNKSFVLVEGNIKGTVANLKGRQLAIMAPGNLSFKGAFDIIGLPNIDRTFISLRVKELKATRRNLNRLFKDLDLEKDIILPANIATLSEMKFKGNFDGFINDFVSLGVLQTDIGKIALDMSLKEPQNTKKEYKFSGKIKTEAFDLGVFYGNSDLGKITTDLAVEGTGLTMDKVSAQVNGEVISIGLRGYNYKNVKLFGKLTQYLFNGRASIKDPNLVLDFDGNLDFRNEIPKLDFEATIAHADLRQLNLYRDANESQFNAIVKVNAVGLKPNDFNGSIDLQNLSYCDGKRVYEVSSLLLDAVIIDETRKFTLFSPLFDGRLEGEFDVEEIITSYKSLVTQSLPSFFDSLTVSENVQNIDIELTIKEMDELFLLFEQDVQVSPFTKLNSKLSSSEKSFFVDLQSKQITYRGKQINDLSVYLESKNEVLRTEISTNSVRFADSLALENLTIVSKAFLDNFQLGIDWSNDAFNNDGSIEAVGMITNKNRFDFDILPSEVNIGNDHWTLSNSAHVTVQENYVRIADLNVYNGKQYFTANGIISESEYDKLQVNIKDFDLANFNPLIGTADYKMSGFLSGKATLANLFTHPIFDVSSDIKSLKINDYNIGNISVQSVWENEIKTASVNASVTKNKKRQVSLVGFYKPFNDDETLDLNLFLNDYEVSSLNIIKTDAISDLDGTADGKVNITGKADSLILDGKIKLNDTHVTINYLNTTYIFNNEISIKPTYFGLNYVPVKDELGNNANVVGTVFHNNFTDWNFDVYLEPENFLCLNTTSGDNEMYYGKAIITGTVGVYGYANNLDIEINAKTEDKTIIYIPLGNSGIAGEQDFVTFIDITKGDSIDNQEVNLEGIKLDLNLEVTPKAQVQLIFDEQLGDIMKGRGAGNIKMEINTLGNFNMFGQYTIEEGDYMFTLQKIINKRFNIKQGGTINWYGSPYGAEIDLTAVYKSRAPLYDILAEKLETYKNRVPVECLMHLTGNLLKPQIEFDIDMPGLNENLKSQIKSQMSSQEELNKQVFALLVLNRFLPTANSGDGVRGASTGTGLGNATTSDLISNQISNWLSQISREFDVGFVYRLGDQISNEELAVALSTQLFNERLTLSGNFGVSNGNQSNQNPNSLIGDFSIEYSLTKDGRLRLKAFNESNDYDLLNSNQAASKQGVGVFYQENFDKFGDWMRAMFKGFKYKTRNGQTQ